MTVASFWLGKDSEIKITTKIPKRVRGRLRSSKWSGRGVRGFGRIGVLWQEGFNSDSGVAPALILDYAGASIGQFFANDDAGLTFADLHSFSRASSATHINDAGLLVTAASGVHRLGHLPVSPFTPKGLLLEKARENLVIQSNNFDTTWNRDNPATPTQVAIGPDGLTSGWLFIDDGQGGNKKVQLYQDMDVDNASAYTFSIFAKKDQLEWLSIQATNFVTPANGTSYFDLNNGVVGDTPAPGHTLKITNEGNGWYRCSITFTTDAVDSRGRILINPADADNDNAVAIDNTSSIFIFGAQFGKGIFPASYVDTTTVAVTRIVDDAPVATSGWDFSATVGSLYGVVTPDHLPVSELILFSLNNGTTDEVIEVYIDSSANVRFRVTDGGVDQCDIDSLVNAVADTELKIAVSWAANDFAISVNGQTVQVDTGGTLPTVDTLDPCESGHTSAVVQYKATLSNADLVARTT